MKEKSKTIKTHITTESQNIEFKQSWHDDYLKWVCGFANAQGGRIYLGKDDSGCVVGLPNVKKLSEDLPNKIRDQLGLMPHINLHQEGGKSFLEIVVEPSTVPISLRGSYYWRSGSTKQELKGHALTDFLLKKMGVTWDRVVEGKATMEDIDDAAIDIFRRDAAKAGRLPDLSDLKPREILQKLRLLTRDGLTRAALVLFGKDPGEFYPNLFVKIGRFGISDADLRFQEVCDGNLIRMLRDVMEQLEKKFLTKPIRFEGIHRIEEMEDPVAALREMLLNAMVHRNCLGSMTQMKVYDNRLTLWNAGVLPAELTIEQLLQVHESIPRNPLLAEVCYKAGYIDSWGRGVEKISDACKDAHLPPPKFIERSGGILVELTSNPTSNTQLTTQILPGNYPDTAQKILHVLANYPAASRLRIAEELGDITENGVKYQLAKMKREGIIRRIGPDRGGHWEIMKNE